MILSIIFFAVFAALAIALAEFIAKNLGQTKRQTIVAFLCCVVLTALFLALVLSEVVG